MGELRSYTACLHCGMCIGAYTDIICGILCKKQLAIYCLNSSQRDIAGENIFRAPHTPSFYYLVGHYIGH